MGPRFRGENLFRLLSRIREVIRIYFSRVPARRLERGFRIPAVAYSGGRKTRCSLQRRFCRNINH
jgi:hypothetical protein